MAKVKYIKKTDEFELWEYKPDILRPFFCHMERITLSWRIRCILEYFVGYTVYYIKKDDVWAGYCVVSNGRNRRYKFATDEDIIYGRYFISEYFRGKGLAYKMLDEILNRAGLVYRHAYAYVNKNNTTSCHVIKKLGAHETKRFNIQGMLRFLHDDINGEYILFDYSAEAIG